MALLCAAIFGCCVAMSLPARPSQVARHRHRHRADAGGHRALGPAGGELPGPGRRVRLMIEWIGGLRTLFLFSLLQAATLGLLPFAEGLGTVLALAAAFGFGYGGIAPAYPVIVREFLSDAGPAAAWASSSSSAPSAWRRAGWIGRRRLRHDRRLPLAVPDRGRLQRGQPRHRRLSDRRRARARPGPRGRALTRLRRRLQIAGARAGQHLDAVAGQQPGAAEDDAPARARRA